MGKMQHMRCMPTGEHNLDGTSKEHKWNLEFATHPLHARTAAKLVGEYNNAR